MDWVPLHLHTTIEEKNDLILLQTSPIMHRSKLWSRYYNTECSVINENREQTLKASSRGSSDFNFCFICKFATHQSSSIFARLLRNNSVSQSYNNSHSRVNSTTVLLTTNLMQISDMCDNGSPISGIRWIIQPQKINSMIANGTTGLVEKKGC